MVQGVSDLEGGLETSQHLGIQTPSRPVFEASFTDFGGLGTPARVLTT